MWESCKIDQTPVCIMKWYAKSKHVTDLPASMRVVQSKWKIQTDLWSLKGYSEIVRELAC